MQMAIKNAGVMILISDKIGLSFLVDFLSG